MIAKIVYGAMCTFALGTLLLGAPAGRLLVGTPPTERVQRDPSLRAGSSGHGFWFFSGGGYHGGK